MIILPAAVIEWIHLQPLFTSVYFLLLILPLLCCNEIAYLFMGHLQEMIQCFTVHSALSQRRIWVLVINKLMKLFSQLSFMTHKCMVMCLYKNDCQPAQIVMMSLGLCWRKRCDEQRRYETFYCKVD